MRFMKYAAVALFLVTFGCANKLVLDKVRHKMHPPAGLQVTFRVLDYEGYPVRQLTENDVTVLNDEKKAPFGAGQEGGGASRPGKPSEFELYAVLALDMSDSIFKNEALDDMLAGAHSFVNKLVEEPEEDMKHKVAIIIFGRTEKIKVITEFTDNPSQLHGALNKLEGSKSLGTTNLYGAYMTAIDLIEGVDTSVDLVERSVVLLTDGTHEAGDEKNMRKKALSAKSKSIEKYQTNFISIGLRGAYDESKLRELASHEKYFVMAENADELNTVLGEVANRVNDIAHSNYIVGICTPVEMGEPTLTIKVVVDDKSGSTTVAYPTGDLTGDITKCDPEDIAAKKPPAEEKAPKEPKEPKEAKGSKAVKAE